MGQPYDPARHPTPPWTWHDDDAWGEGGGYWELDGSRGTDDPSGAHSCNCVQYVLAKIQGRRPRRDDSTEHDDIPPTLQRLGYRETDCGNCGCGPEQCRDCVVVYKDGGAPYHVAVFDRQTCDWGGKLNGGLGIARYKKPGDYVRGAANVTMTCYCRNPPGPYISDELINRGYLQPGQLDLRAWFRGVLDWLRRLWRRLRRLFGG